MTRNYFRSIINSGIWTSILIPTLTRIYIERTFFFIVHSSLCFVILNKTRGETYVILVKQHLDHNTKLSSLPVCSLFSFPYSGIPVIILRCVWPDNDGYRNTKWAQRVSLYRRRSKSQS